MSSKIFARRRSAGMLPASGKTRQNDGTTFVSPALLAAFLILSSSSTGRQANQPKPTIAEPEQTDLAVLHDLQIGCLYKRGERGSTEKVTFARFSLAWLTDGADSLPLSPP